MHEIVSDSLPRPGPSAGLLSLKDRPVFGEATQKRSSWIHWKYLAAALSFAGLTLLAFLVVQWVNSYTVRATLERSASNRSESLLSGDRISSGDRLYFELESSEPVFAYVLGRDEQGRAYLLFPLAGYDLSNPVPAGKVAHLPGNRSGSEVFWQVTGRSAREYFLIVTALRRLVDFENQLQMVPTGQAKDPATPIPVPDSAMQALAAMGGVPSHEGSSQAVTHTERVFQQAQTLSAQAERIHGVWVRRIVLQNPEAGLFGQPR